MTEHDVHLLAAVYSLDALDDAERAAFEEHLAVCEACREEVAGFSSVHGPLAQSQAVPPPVSVKERVLREVGQSRQVSPLVGRALTARPDTSGSRAGGATRRAWLFAAVAAAASLALAVVGVAVFSQEPSSDRFAADLAQVLEQPDARMLGLAGQSGPVNSADQLGTGPSGSGQFKVAWSDSLHRAVLIGEGLSEAPEGKAYELWLITADQSMAMHILDPANDGTVHASFDMPHSPTKWAITIEPHSGTEVATGEIIFVGAVD